MQPSAPRRAVVANLGPVARIGMARVVEDGGFEVVGGADHPDDLVEEVRQLQPDAVVLGVGGSDAGDLSERLRHAAPLATVLLWARDEGELRVFDPGSDSPRLIRKTPSDALLRELTAVGATTGME